MIQEIVNYTKHLKENSPHIFEQGLEPTKGLHIFVELDEDGNAINFPGEKGVDWDYYDETSITPFLKNIISYEQSSQRVGTTMNKAIDKKKQIVSCSPYVLSFKKEKLENEKIVGKNFDKIKNLLPYYFEKSIQECLEKNEKSEILENKINSFKEFILKELRNIDKYEIFNEMKKSSFINLYLKNISISDYENAHDNYLKRNLFNKNDYNSDAEISKATYGLSNFFNGLNIKKPFLEHKTGSMFKGLSSRIQAKHAVFLNNFDILLKRKVFPQPMPIFIDKNEFANSEEILSIFKEDRALTYSQILKKIFNKNDNRILQNYYLLYFNYKYELEDFDFVSKFRYSLKTDDKYPEIKNIFELKKNNEIIPTKNIKNIFQFEADIVKTIFNNSLVKIKDDSFKASYFDEITPEYVSGGEPIYQMILKYRKAFYDYIYKSMTQAINSYMWDDIMWNSIIGDLRYDKMTDKGYHSKEYSIKDKLNIWFSLYNYFDGNTRRKEMGSKIPQLLDKMKEVANNENVHFDTTEEFAFGAGQVIYYLFNQSKASERTHALLEPFIQKVKVEQLQNSIAQTVNTYKHELSFGQGRFERLMAEVLGFYTNENLKNYQRLLLAGYFAVPVIYEKKIEEKKED